MKKKLDFCYLLPVAALILEILPVSAVLVFAHPAADGTMLYERRLYSHISGMLIGYGNFGPFLTALCTCLVLILLVIFSITGRKGLRSGAKIVCDLAAAASLLPLVMGGTQLLCIGGAAVTVLLLAESILLYKAGRAQT